MGRVRGEEVGIHEEECVRPRGGWRSEWRVGIHPRERSQVCQGESKAGFPGTERSVQALGWELFGLEREVARELAPAGNGLGFLRKEEGPGVRTRSARC